MVLEPGIRGIPMDRVGASSEVDDRTKRLLAAIDEKLAALRAQGVASTALDELQAIVDEIRSALPPAR